MLIKKHIYNSLSPIYPDGECNNIATLICRHILGLSELDIYTGKYINLSPEKKILLENSISRLKQFEPIQYVLGTTEFMGLPFKVAPGVLIPRPETEELVNLIIERTTNAECRILDIGTGSGCIAISLARHFPNAQVEGWDLKPEAIEIARENNRNLKSNVVFNQIDILTYQPTGVQFEILVSNPPYITEREKKEMDRNVLDWEPASALFVPDSDPLLFYRRIAETGKSILVPGGKIYFEINSSYGKQTAALLEETGYREVTLIKDLFEKDRIITATK